MAYTVTLTRRARRGLVAITQVDQVRIVQALVALQVDPRPSGVKALQGQVGLLRLRVGDYRIVYRVEDTVLEVLIVRIGHRRDVYRGM